MVIILTKLESAQTVMGGFASTTWFMTLGVLGLGAAITGSGLFYRLSLHLVPHVSAQLLLADCRDRHHGRRRHGVDSAANRAHGDHQPNARQSLRKPGLQDSIEGVDRLVRRQLSRPGPIGVSILDRIDDQLDRLGLVTRRRARAIYLGLLVSRRLAADSRCIHHHLLVHDIYLSARDSTEDFLHDGADAAQYSRTVVA